MSDFFGGILDDLRGDSSNSTTPGFLASLLGSGGDGGKTEGLVNVNSDSYGRSYTGGFDDPFNYKGPPKVDQREPAADFNTIESQWVRRMQKFAEIPNETKVPFGKGAQQI